MVRVGIVGIGFMGMIHYLAAQRASGLKVVALCSRDAKKLAGDWTSIQGNFGPRGTQMDLSGLSCYRDFEELLADPEVDLVDLCVPNDSHAAMAIQALRAGKHVLVEKPIALSTSAADEMVEAATAAGKLLMVGHVLPFFPEFAFALDAVRSGRYGSLQAAHLLSRHLEARLVQRHRRRRAQRRAGHRSAYPRHALRRTRLRHTPRRAFAGNRPGRRRRSPEHPVSLRQAGPHRLVHLRCAQPGGPAFRPRVRVLSRACYPRIRIRQPGRGRPPRHAPVRDPARRDGRAPRASEAVTQSTPSHASSPSRLGQSHPRQKLTNSRELWRGRHSKLCLGGDCERSIQASDRDCVIACNLVRIPVAGSFFGMDEFLDSDFLNLVRSFSDKP